MSGKLRAVRAKLINIFAFEECELALGKFTLLTGRNGTGKTTALEAIRSLWRGSAHDATLLRKGTKAGEVCLIMSDGVEVARQTFEGKTLMTVRAPTLGKVTATSAYMKGLTGELSLNPVELLTAKPERQKELAVRALPVHITSEQVEAALGFPLKIPCEGHAFDVLAAAEKLYYDDRTHVNREVKTKLAAAEQMEQSLPQLPVEGDWSTEVSRCDAELNRLQEEWAGKRLEVIREGAEVKSRIQQSGNERINAIKRQVDAEMKVLEQQAVAAIHAVEAEMHAEVRGQEELERETRDALAGAYEPQREQCLAKKAQAQTMADQYMAARAARSLAAGYRQEASALAEEAEALTRGLEGLRTLKATLTRDLPIAGLEIGASELYIDGIPFGRAPESRKIMVAIELAMLSAGNLPFIIVDGLEALDARTFELFVQTIRAYDAQVLGAKVSEAERLTVEEVLGAETDEPHQG